MKECAQCTLTPTCWRGVQAQLSSAVRGQSFKVSAVADWQFALTGLSGPSISCVKQQHWPGCFQKSWGGVWQAESSHSRCSLTLPSPQANAQMQMSAQATGRGDKTHQVTLPFRTVNTLPLSQMCNTFPSDDNSHPMWQATFVWGTGKRDGINWETEAADLQTLIL